MTEEVILVDQNDRVVGTKSKLAAHHERNLHRAFSIFIINSKGQLLLQRRASNKYHSGGLWSNTCCGHPRPEEGIRVAAHRRLVEEMGFDCELAESMTVVYNLDVGKSIFENEYVHILVGAFEGQPHPNSAEVSDWRWTSFDQFDQALKRQPETHTAWLQLTWPKVAKAYRLLDETNSNAPNVIDSHSLISEQTV